MAKRRASGGSSSGGRGRGRGRGRKASNSSNKNKGPASNTDDARTAHDIFEAEDVDADEDLHAYRYDDVENNEYELPEDFEDEEIDEDEAFNSEDERLYGHFFRDSGTSEEESQEGDAAFDALESSSDDSGDDEAWPDLEQGGEDVTTGEDVYPDIGEQKADGGSEDDDDFDDDYEKGDVPAEETMRERKQLLTEAYPESVFHISTQGHGEGLTVEDLLAGLGENQSKLGAARKSLEKLSKKISPLDAPLPGPIQERQERKAAYDESKKDIQKWMPLVKSHREAPTLKLSSNKSDVHKPSTISSIAAKHKPGNSMELEVAAMLEAAGAHTASAVAESEDALAMRMLSAEEAKARKEELAKQRALLFYHEVKAKRLKKIKSKEYRRRLKKAEKKKSNAATGEDGMLLLDEEELKQQREEAEYARAKERLTLKHKNTSRFIRRAIMRGSQHAPDESTREAIAEQLRLGEEIRKKVHSFKDKDSESSSEDDSSDEEREDARISRKLEAAARDVLEDNDGPGEEKGLMSLPFMKRSMEKKRKAAVDHAENILEENGQVKKKSGRMAFGNGNGAATQTEEDMRVEDIVTEDEDEDAEAKYQRLTKQQKGYVASVEPSKDRDFISAKKFDGVKEGYMFTNGPKGVGYYSDLGSTKPSPAPSKEKEGKKSTKQHATFTQEDLIKKAFAGDDVVEEFKKSKKEEVEGELPQEEVPGELPGWGTWSRQKKEPAWVQQAKAKAEAKKKAAARARKDAGMEYVVISEKWDTKNAKYKTQSVPYPFNSKETYERSLRQPLGKEFNTVDSFRNLTRPSIIKDNGVIIEPLKYSAAVGTHNNNQSMAKRSSILQVHGGMPQRTSKKK